MVGLSVLRFELDLVLYVVIWMQCSLFLFGLDVHCFGLSMPAHILFHIFFFLVIFGLNDRQILGISSFAVASTNPDTVRGQGRGRGQLLK